MNYYQRDDQTIIVLKLYTFTQQILTEEYGPGAGFIKNDGISIRLGNMSGHKHWGDLYSVPESESECTQVRQVNRKASDGGVAWNC